MGDADWQAEWAICFWYWDWWGLISLRMVRFRPSKGLS